jgi:hypothetical protein|eukprot:COSAG02_NODE_118_length_35376_cov_20.294923_11_plen_148_part_00
MEFILVFLGVSIGTLRMCFFVVFFWTGAGQHFKLLGNPSLSDTTHNSQSTYIQPVAHADGSTTLLYMSDRWCWDGFAWAGQPGHLHPGTSPTSNFTCVASGNVSNATYVWLPLYPNESAPSGWSLPWLARWRIGDPAYRIPAGNAQL